MSDVKRYYIGVYDGEAQARVCLAGLKGMIRDSDGKIFTLSEDFDAAQSELAALREELETETMGLQYRLDVMTADRDALQQRLTATEQRNSELEELLRSTRDCYGSVLSLYTLDKIAATLKPTESGASE